MKIEFSGLAEQFFDPLRIINTGQLDQNTFFALPLNCWLPCSRFINSAADDFDGLRHGAVDPRADGLFRQGQGKTAVTSRLNVNFPGWGPKLIQGRRLKFLGKLCFYIFSQARVPRRKNDRQVTNAQPFVFDLGTTKEAAHRILHP